MIMTEIQRCHRKCATKQPPGMKNIPYEERLEIFKLPILAYIRTRGDMIEVYQLLQGKYDSDLTNVVKLHKDSDTRQEQGVIFLHC